jgi:hypothetical protein
MRIARDLHDAKQLVDLHDVEKVKIQKTELPELPERFDDYLPANGMQNDGAIGSYRDGCEHVIEYEDHWKYHIDDVDPEEDPIGHAITDAPEDVALLCLLCLIWYFYG